MSIKMKINACCYLLKTWLTVIPRIIYRSSISLITNPKESQCFIHQVLNAQDLESDDLMLGSHDISELLPASNVIDIQIVGPYYNRRSGGTGLLMELANLAYIMQALKPQFIFEIGTFVGRTTRLFANNAPPTSRIFTLDLPPELVQHKIGEAFQGTPESKRITQLKGDSQVFDFSPFYGKCDFVWVDACHDYKWVQKDSEIAFKLCRTGGWIAWHDYRKTAWWSGVTRCVRELHKIYPKLVHLRGTTIAVLPGKK
ncbi:class I SAM-dependent methyltransferase [bacterium]|nr:class I SAM-dependent methyltransferase [bacterium]